MTNIFIFLIGIQWKTLQKTFKTYRKTQAQVVWALNLPQCQSTQAVLSVWWPSRKANTLHQSVMKESTPKFQLFSRKAPSLLVRCLFQSCRALHLTTIYPLSLKQESLCNSAKSVLSFLKIAQKPNGLVYLPFQPWSPTHDILFVCFLHFSGRTSLNFRVVGSTCRVGC